MAFVSGVIDKVEAMIGTFISQRLSLLVICLPA